MAGQLRKHRRRHGIPLPVTIFVLVLLAVAVMALSYMAVKRPTPQEPQGIPTISTRDSAAPTMTPPEADTEQSDPVSPTETPEPQPTGEPLELAVPTRVLAAVDSQIFIRATGGTCQAPGTLETSQDGGASWKESDSLSESGATQILRVLSTDIDLIQVIAMDDDCRPALFITEDQGSSWQPMGQPTAAWYLVSPDQIMTPSGVRDLGCQAIAMAAVEDRAAVLCADSTVVTTEDQGDTWADPVAVIGAVAISVAPENGYFMAVTGAPNCQGVQTLALRDSVLTQRGACLAVDDIATGNITNGDVAVARAGDIAAAWVGSTFAVSQTGGLEW